MFLLGVIPIIVVLIGRSFIQESDRFRHVQEVKQAKSSGDEARVRSLLREYDVDVEEIEDVTVKQLFTHPGYVRRQLIMLHGGLALLLHLVRRDQPVYITDFMTTGSRVSRGRRPLPFALRWR